MDHVGAPEVDLDLCGLSSRGEDKNKQLLQNLHHLTDVPQPLTLKILDLEDITACDREFFLARFAIIRNG